jgi:hypothetical protein
VAGVAADASFAVSIASFDISDNSSRQAADPSGAQVLGAGSAWVGGMFGGIPGAAAGGGIGAIVGHALDMLTDDIPDEYEENKVGSEDQFKPKY